MRYFRSRPNIFWKPIFIFSSVFTSYILNEILILTFSSLQRIILSTFATHWDSFIFTFSNVGNENFPMNFSIRSSFIRKKQQKHVFRIYWREKNWQPFLYVESNVVSFFNLLLLWILFFYFSRVVIWLESHSKNECALWTNISGVWHFSIRKVDNISFHI